MHPILFEAFGRQIASYGACMLLGAAAAALVVYLLMGRRVFTDVWYAFLICICGGIVGAFFLRPVTRIPELLINWEAFRSADIGVVLGYLFGEIVFYGGLLGGAAALVIYCNKCMLPILPVADLFAPALAVAHAFGRVGCFLGGCCYGVHVDAAHPFAVRFPPETAGGAPVGEALLAVQLIEAACLLVIAAVLAIVYLKSETGGLSPRFPPCFHPRSSPTGLTVCLYGILYPVLRFVLEFYRGDLVRGVYGPFSTSQYISIAIFCASAALLTFICRKYRITAKR